MHDTYYTLYITVAHRVMCNSVYVTLHIEILLYVMYSTIFFLLKDNNVKLMEKE